MRAPWHALNSQLLLSTTRMSFQTTFQSICSRYPPLSPFRNPAGLLDYLHSPGGDPAGKNDILRALVVEAQAESETTEGAVTLILLALWPGLDAIRGRLHRHVADPEELASEISARAALGVRTMNLAKVNRLAATLLRNVERDLKRDLARRRREAPGNCRAEELVDFVEEGPLFGFGQRDPNRGRADLVDALTEVIGDDAELVVAVVNDGFTQREAADHLGITHSAARKRYQRALNRLASRVEDFGDRLSQSSPATGFFPSEAANRGASRENQDA